MKRISTMVIILVALIAIYLGVRNLGQPSNDLTNDTVGITKIDTDQVDEITITSASTKLTLTKQAGKWFVKDTVPVDQMRIDDFFAAVSKAQVTSRASSNPDNYARFEISDDKAAKLEMISNGQTIQTWFVGKSAGGESVYLRLTGDDNVYVFDGLSRYLVSEQEDIWRDRTILAAKADQISSVRLSTFGRLVWGADRTNDKWYLVDARGGAIEVDTTKTESLLNEIMELKATAFPSAEEVGKLAEKDLLHKVEFKISGVEEAMIWEVYKTQQENQLILKRQDNISFMLTQTQFEQIFADYSTVNKKLLSTEE